MYNKRHGKRKMLEKLDREERINRQKVCYKLFNYFPFQNLLLVTLTLGSTIMWVNFTQTKKREKEKRRK